MSTAMTANDNLTGVAHKDSSGTTQASESYTINSNGLTTDAYDANSITRSTASTPMAT